MLALILAAALAAPGPLKVALMPLSAGDGVPEKTAQSISDALAAEMRQIQGLQLMTGDQLTAVLSVERQKQLMGCQSDSCMAEVAGALDADRLVMGSVAKLGRSWIIHLQLVDAKKAMTLQHSDRRKKGGNIDDILDELPKMTRELFGKSAEVSAEPPPLVAPPPVSPGTKGLRVDSTADVPYGEVDRGKLQVAEDDAGHVYVFVPFAGLDGPLFFGAGTALYAQRLFGGGSEAGKRFDWVFWEPRARSPSQASFSFRDDTYTVTCGKRDVPLKLASVSRAKAVLDQARFMKPRWARHAYALARDDEGNYFYVDQAREPDDNKDFHVYLGTQGEMLPVSSKVLASDTGGDLFGTANGRLRLTHSPAGAEWMSPAGTQKLHALEVQDNAHLIYGGLGVYKGQSLGTPCDGMLAP